MPQDAPRYAGFFGTWILIPESCDFEQGDPPLEGVYVIDERDGKLCFEIRWVGADGSADRVTLSAVPDGTPMPFAGGDLADELCVEVVSERDVRKTARYRGKERMITQLQLDDTQMAMRVTQVVLFSDGTHLSNVSVYRRGR